MNIREIMSKPAVTCRPSETLNAAAQLMWEHDCGVIPVVGDDGAVVGIITDRDICMSAYTQASPLHAIPVSDAMTRQVFTCHASDTLDDAERLMSEKQIRRLPVVDDDNEIIGVLSLNDVALYAASTRKKDGLDHELAATLAAICKPRSQSRRTQPRGQARPQ